MDIKKALGIIGGYDGLSLTGLYDMTRELVDAKGFDGFAEMFSRLDFRKKCQLLRDLREPSGCQATGLTPEQIDQLEARATRLLNPRGKAFAEAMLPRANSPGALEGATLGHEQRLRANKVEHLYPNDFLAVVEGSALRSHKDDLVVRYQLWWLESRSVANPLVDVLATFVAEDGTTHEHRAIDNEDNIFLHEGGLMRRVKLLGIRTES